MKIAIIGDLHIAVKSSNEVMMRHQARFFEFFLGELKKRDVKTIIQLGDIWDNRRQVNFRALQFAQETFFAHSQCKSTASGQRKRSYNKKLPFVRSKGSF